MKILERIQLEKPKRKPDLVLKTESFWGCELYEVIEVWFKELVMLVYDVEPEAKNKFDKKLYELDRFQSLKKNTWWTCVVDGSIVSYLTEDLNDEFETKDLGEKIEKAYQGWLADKAIEKLFKNDKTKSHT